MALCTVRHGRDWMEVCSPTGVQIRIQNPRSVSLTGPEESLTYLLMTGASPRAEELSHDQMRVFLAIRQKVQDVIPKEPEPVEEETEEEQEEAVEATPAPVVVVSTPTPDVEDRSAQFLHDTVVGRATRHMQTNTEEQRINCLQTGLDRVRTGKLIVFHYDIRDEKRRECPNPSGWLWRHAFRWTESVWVITEQEIKHPKIQDLFALWDEHKIKHYIVPQDESQKQLLIKIAQDNLTEEIRRVHQSFINRLLSADEKYRELVAAREDAADKGMQGDASKEDLDRKHANTVRAIVREVGEDLNNAIKCAELYDQEENVQDLLVGLREAISAEVKSRNVILWIGRGRGKRK